MLQKLQHQYKEEESRQHILQQQQQQQQPLNRLPGPPDDVQSLNRSKIERSKLKPSTKRFACSHEGCLKTFSTSGHMARHKRIHTGVKSYLCPMADCDRKFSRKDNLVQHIKSHVRRLSLHRQDIGIFSTAKTFTDISPNNELDPPTDDVLQHLHLELSLLENCSSSSSLSLIEDEFHDIHSDASSIKTFTTNTSLTCSSSPLSSATSTTTASRSASFSSLCENNTPLLLSSGEVGRLQRRRSVTDSLRGSLGTISVHESISRNSGGGHDRRKSMLAEPSVLRSLSAQHDLVDDGDDDDDGHGTLFEGSISSQFPSQRTSDGMFEFDLDNTSTNDNISMATMTNMKSESNAEGCRL